MLVLVFKYIDSHVNQQELVLGVCVSCFYVCESVYIFSTYPLLVVVNILDQLRGLLRLEVG